MSKQRVVRDEIWDDDWFFDLSSDEKLVWLFLLTNPRGNIAGIYKLNKKWAALATGLDSKTFNTILKKFVKDSKIIDAESWIGLLNFHKHLAYRNDSVAQGILRLYKERTGCPQALDSLWVTLLNSTLLYLSVSEDKSSPLRDELKTILMGWKSHNENAHSDDLPSVDMDSGQVIEEKKKSKSQAPVVFDLFKEILGSRSTNWLINKTQRKAAENLLTDKGVDKIKNALEFYKENQDSEYCPRISSPFDLDSKWENLKEFKKKNES